MPHGQSHQSSWINTGSVLFGKKHILYNRYTCAVDSVHVSSFLYPLSPKIDFVAHDDIPYTSAGSEDVYKHIKAAGNQIQNITEQVYELYKVK